MVPYGPRLTSKRGVDETDLLSCISRFLEHLEYIR